MKNFLTSNTLVTQIFLMISIIASIYGFYIYGITLENIALIIFGYFLYVCLGIVVMFHRNLTHGSYKTHPLIEKIFSFLGCMSNTGSSIVWVAIHLKHHLHSDKPGDPHSPWIRGWKVFLLNYPIDSKIKFRLKHLIKDPYHRFLHRYYYGLLILWSLILYALGGFYLVIFLHWAPIVVSAIMSNIVNYAGHMEKWWGSYKRFKLSDRSCNNWIWALPTWGEAWHNNHHRYPKNYTTSQKWWEIDVSGMIIRMIRITNE